MAGVLRYLSATYMNLGYTVFGKIKLRIIFENKTQFFRRISVIIYKRSKMVAIDLHNQTQTPILQIYNQQLTI